MVTAEVAPGHPLRVLAEDREVTRLGESVFRTGSFSRAALDAASTVLERMARTYQKLEVQGVRAVATSATRDASNQEEFLERASVALGVPVEVISGQEEARLIHLGVHARWPHPQQAILIIDIGGGSAEIILSEKGHLVTAYSKPVGAVRLKEVFLKKDPPDPHELHQLEEYIEEKVAPVIRRIRGHRIDRFIGTSATMAALASAVNRIGKDKREAADRLRAPAVEIRKLYQKLCKRDLAGRRQITGIGPRRAEVIVPGAALCLHLLREFQAPAIYYSIAGVRDGVVADLAARGVGRELARLNSDQRQLVEEMARRYAVEVSHVRKVAALANTLFDSLQPVHQLAPQYGKILEAAAYLHDVGHFVSDTRHHKHSLYLVANSDMPGFNERERELIANLCRYHRKSPPQPSHPNYQALSEPEQSALTRLIPLLRLADGLDQSHGQRVQSVECRVGEDGILLVLRAKGDTDLEQWAAGRVADLFRSVFQRPLSIYRAS